MAVSPNPQFPQVEGYRLIERLYQTKQTAVYRGILEVPQRNVVVKLLYSNGPSTGELVKFCNQYTIARNLSIPGVVKPLELKLWRDGYALVMEDFGGIGLREYIRAQRLLWQDVLAIALQIANILHDLHQACIIHKDIKPANLLIHPQTKQISLIDFSLASLLPKETQKIQCSNALKGTPTYMAPEQTGQVNLGIDYRADFYNLGVTLYELLTGQLPFCSDDPMELAHCHIAKAPIAVHEVNAQVPAMLSAIVGKLMAKNAEDRYQSALDLKHDLQQCDRQWTASGRIEKFELGQWDESDRKRAERTSQLSAALAKATFDQVAVGFAESDLTNGKIIRTNDWFCRMTGYTTQEFEGLTVADLTHPDDLSESLNQINQLRTGLIDSFTVEKRYIRRDGSCFWANTAVSLIQSREEDSPRCLAAVQDISDRKMAELSLQQSEETFRTLVSNIHGAVYRSQHDAAWTINYMSDAILDLSGYPASDFIENTVRTYASIIHPDDTDYVEQAVAQAISKQESFLLEYRILHQDGSIRWVYEKGKGIFDLQNQIQHLEGVIFDISNRKRAEAKLLHTNEELIRATRLKDEFLANMSHELRTPLNSVIGFSQLMQEDSDLSEKHRETLNIINRSGEHLLSLINDILEMSKIEAGRTTLNLELVDLPQLLHELKNMLQLKADAKNLGFAFSYATDIPHHIEADEVKLKQILLNLLSNALKFTERGQVTFSAKLLQDQCAETETKAHLRFSVTDTGPGISVENQKTIFQPFIQALAGKHSHQGTGLGLPISQKFAEMMGGNIAVSSIYGQGSTFQCDIWVNSHSFDQVIETTSPQRYKNIRGLKNPQVSYRLLVVDDNLDNCALLLQMLSVPGFELKTAKDGRKAVEWNEYWQPDLIWMDIRMPVMDGLEAVRQIRRSAHQPKIIAITANAFAEEREIALEAGCDDFISKPFAVNEVFERLERWLDIEFIRELETEKMPIETNPDNSFTSTSKSKSKEELIQAGYGNMSAEWRLAFQQAVHRLNDKAVSSLLSEVPKEHQAMVDMITELQADYRYDILGDLIKQAI